MISTPRILIVDDEPRICDSLRLLLSGQGYKIQTANSGQTALGCLSEDRVDLALLDLMLPDMNGLELMAYVKRKRPNTPVIVISGHGTMDTALEALRKGAYDYLRKPFEFEELLKTVENAFGQKMLEEENKVINEKLRLSEDRYRQLVQNSPDIIYTIDADGNFAFVSDAVKRLTGYESDELIGKDYTSIIHEEDLGKARRLFEARRTGHRATYGTELRLRVHGHDDRFKFYEVKHLTLELEHASECDAPIIGQRRKFVSTHGVARDITDRKHLEAQVQRAQKMEALGTLSAGIAHDFNNLLMGIQGNTSLLLNGISANHSHYEKLKGLQEHVQSGTELTRQLLDFARGEKHDVKPLNIHASISKTVEMFARIKKDVVIHENYKGGTSLVDADRGQIEQVLVNLYLNAFQAMPEGGDLYLKTECVILDEDFAGPFGIEPGRYMEISVTDTGVGMDDATQKRIFEPFFTTKEMGKGTGLGLASAYNIIKNHGGIIDVSSERDDGTTFKIYLPVSHSKMTEEREEPSEEFLAGTETVLLVDDEDVIIDVGEEMLQEMGYKVLLAENGKEAIDVYKRNMGKIHIVILDMIMSAMGGGEVYDRLKHINPNVKTLLSSGYSLSGQASEILKRGCNGFIQKPFNMSQLSRKIREILDRP